MPGCGVVGCFDAVQVGGVVSLKVTYNTDSRLNQTEPEPHLIPAFFISFTFPIQLENIWATIAK